MDSLFLDFGAGDVTRTHDLLITNQLHYRLCYTSDSNIIIQKTEFVNSFLIKIKKITSDKAKASGTNGMFELHVSLRLNKIQA